MQEKQPLTTKILRTTYRSIFKPIFFKIDPETTHERAKKAAYILTATRVTKYLTEKTLSYEHPMLGQTLADIHFKNPVGLAAGFDKDADFVEIMPCVGFGFQEIGSITGKPYAGNPGTRLWRLPEAKGLIVYYGLKNKGADVLKEKMKLKKSSIPLGISAAKTNCKETTNTQKGIEDYCTVLESFRSIGAYYTLNLSCPNSFGGQDFQNAKKLEQLLRQMKKLQLFCKPVFLKMSAELEKKELDALLAVAQKYPVTGFICSNLLKKKENVQLSEKEEKVWTKGGVSGKQCKKHALRQVAYIYKKTKGKMIVIGCGGIFCAADAYEYICHGASLVQLITGMIYQGPQLIGEINHGLVQFLQRDGFKNVGEAVGSKIDKSLYRKE